MKEYAYQLAAEMYAGMPLDRWEGNQYTERGSELEEEARIAYEHATQAWVDHVGFCTDGRNEDEDYGCSPDGLIGESGMLEIKCLVAKNHVKSLMYHDKHKKLMPDYVSQVQMQLFVCQREWCEVCFYHPEVGLFIVGAKPEKEFQEMLAVQIQACITMRNYILEVMKEKMINVEL
ncbi:MAG: YqaJ viral recombinase family protein [Planctomycetes bacterium]|nr:YqaJ viral recombinase family protein [Planctomycetota bacterium]